MTEKEKIERSNLAAEFLKSRLWIEYLEPWIESQRKRLMEDYISLPLEEKFHVKMEDIKSRYTACSIMEQQLKNWTKDRELIERDKELEKARQAMSGPKRSK